MFLSALVFFQQLFGSLAWGPVGHSLVARLAQTQLTSPTNRWLSNYLSWDLHDDLSRVASWPDAILYPDSNPYDFRQWQWSRDLHFINTPSWNCQYVPMRDCLHERCIEGALKNYSRRLVASDCDYIQQQQALFFLVHFVGDIHQPLHTGFAGDFGGNAVKGFFLNSSKLTNLHAIWDVEIIDARIHRHFQADVYLYFDYLKSLSENQSYWTNETADDYPLWIKESLDLVCQQVYLDDSGQKVNVSVNFTLGETYFQRNWPAVDQRLVQAGRRLANKLNQLVAHRSATKLPPHIQAFIVIFALEFLVCVLAVTAFLWYRMKYLRKSDVLLVEERE